MRRQRIVILGAGFAGLYAALELERTVACYQEVEVLLVDPQNFLLFTPMLHEVASGSLDPSSIVVPIRETLRRVDFLQAHTTAVDFAARTVTVAYGADRSARTIVFDHLLIAAGSQTRFPPGLRPHVHGMKTIHDALVLRNWLIGLLERAEIEEDPARRRALLTIAVAGGGFSGVETIGAINDFLLEVARHYRRACAELPKLVLIESNDRLPVDAAAPGPEGSRLPPVDARDVLRARHGATAHLGEHARRPHRRADGHCPRRGPGATAVTDFVIKAQTPMPALVPGRRIACH